MRKPKRIFVIGDFKCEAPRAIFLDEKRFVKGLIRNGCDVQTFSYRNILSQYNPFSGRHFRRFFPKFARKTADEILSEQIRYYYPEIVLFLTTKYMTPQTVAMARRSAPDALFVGRDGDPFPEAKPERVEMGALMDIMIMPSGGRFLQVYKDAGVRRCAFVPFTADPELHEMYPPEAQWAADLSFLGAAKHSKIDFDPDRYEIAKRLSEMPNAKVFACFGRPKTLGLDCFKAISSAKIGISLNVANDVRLYHSDRFINIPACGAFELAKRVPGYELMFEDGRHLRYFDTVEECFELADWYLKNETERETIARAGMAHAHAAFNCTKIAGCFLDIIEKGSCDEPWNYVI